MNEVEGIVEEMGEDSLLSYQLDNGTHILIHRSNTPTSEDWPLGSIGKSSTLPLLFLENGQIAFQNGNGEICGSAVFKYGIVNKPGVGNILTLEGRMSPRGLPIRPHTSDTVIDDLTNAPSINLKGQVIKLENFVETVTTVTYKCRRCPYLTMNTNELMQHLKNGQCQVMTGPAKVSKDNLSLEPKLPHDITTVRPTTDEEDARMDAAQIITDQLDSTHTEDDISTLLFLCGQCSQGFSNLETCKKHMIKDHNLTLEDDSLHKENSVGNFQHSSEAQTQIVPKSKSRGDLVKRKNARHSLATERKVRCGVRSCVYKFTSEKMCAFHMNCHATDENTSKDFQCVSCSERFDRWHTCALHLWHEHQMDVDLLTCTLCNKYRTVTAVKLANHMKIHGELRGYQCSKCGKAFKQASQLRNHSTMHMDRKMAVVPRCTLKQRSPWVNRYFYVYDSMLNSFMVGESGVWADVAHMTHSPSFLHPSPPFNVYGGHMVQGLTFAMDWTTDDGETGVQSQSVVLRYATQRCNICSKTYADSKCLKKHIQAVHSKLRPYVCQVCGHASSRKAMLQMHLRQHTGEKPYSCPHCEYRTGDHNSLRRHIMRHSGQRQYRCLHCPFTSIQSNAYKNHLRSRHAGLSGLFVCTQCPFETISEDIFLLHVSDHKNGIIPAANGISQGNVAAAHLIYRCFNPNTLGGTTMKANLTGNSTSEDGSTQTITIQIPAQSDADLDDDDDTSHCFLALPQSEDDEAVGVDTGGITIPAEQTENMRTNTIS
uniref:C2H2-type domain-containing protein n=1 Tax=Timema tahoe TaxID=61484 RepID=A0A7R9IM00_9NEOP|nr:unnamed protein product [Timema tahoe]